MMIKVKSFLRRPGNLRDHEHLDNAVNNFIAENDVEIVDIKYSTSMSSN